MFCVFFLQMICSDTIRIQCPIVFYFFLIVH